MTRSIWPNRRRIENNATPTSEPNTPPDSSTEPILKSTLSRLQCASTPLTEVATVWLDWVATATAGGTPMKISSGVIRKPPPTPNRPDRNPTPPPRPSNSSTDTESSAIGK